MTTGILMGNITGAYMVNVTFDPASVSTITTAEQTVTVPGLRAGDFVMVSKPSLTAGLGIAGCRSSATLNNTAYITFVNPTAGSVDAGSEVYTFLVFRPAAKSVKTIISD